MNYNRFDGRFQRRRLVGSHRNIFEPKKNKETELWKRKS
jgi:hypothetical protein